MYNFLFLANKGMDIIRIDAVPYIWKELGSSCRNLPRVHTIVRMMRMIGEIVCPSVILLGEVVMEPVKVVPYLAQWKPECQLLYNVGNVRSWHTVATRTPACRANSWTVTLWCNASSAPWYDAAPHAACCWATLPLPHVLLRDAGPGGVRTIIL